MNIDQSWVKLQEKPRVIFIEGSIKVSSCVPLWRLQTRVPDVYLIGSASLLTCGPRLRHRRYTLQGSTLPQEKDLRQPHVHT